MAGTVRSSSMKCHLFALDSRTKYNRTSFSSSLKRSYDKCGFLIKIERKSCSYVYVGRCWYTLNRCEISENFPRRRQCAVMGRNKARWSEFWLRGEPAAGSRSVSCSFDCQKEAVAEEEQRQGCTPMNFVERLAGQEN